MKYGQLIEYNMRNIFQEKSYTKCGRETIPISLSKIENCAYLWINSLKYRTVNFYCMSKSKAVEIYRN